MNLSDLPIIGPLLALLRSRKFIITFSAIIVNVAVTQLPELLPARDILMSVVTLGSLGLVGTIAWEDRAKFARDAGAAFDNVDLETLIRSILGEVIDVVLTGKVPADIPPAVDIPRG